MIVVVGVCMGDGLPHGHYVGVQGMVCFTLGSQVPKVGVAAGIHAGAAPNNFIMVLGDENAGVVALMELKKHLYAGDDAPKFHPVKATEHLVERHDQLLALGLHRYNAGGVCSAYTLPRFG